MKKKKAVTSDSSDENELAKAIRKRKLKNREDYLSDISDSEIDSPPVLKKFISDDNPPSTHSENDSPATSDTCKFIIYFNLISLEFFQYISIIALYVRLQHLSSVVNL